MWRRVGVWFDRTVDPVVSDLITVKKFQQRFPAVADVETGEGDVRAWVSPRFGFEVRCQFDAIGMSVAADVYLPPFESGGISKTLDPSEVENFVTEVETRA